MGGKQHFECTNVRAMGWNALNYKPQTRRLLNKSDEVPFPFRIQSIYEPNEVQRHSGLIVGCTYDGLIFDFYTGPLYLTTLITQLGEYVFTSSTRLSAITV